MNDTLLGHLIIMHMNIQANATCFFKNSLKTWMSWANFTPLPPCAANDGSFQKGPHVNLRDNISRRVPELHRTPKPLHGIMLMSPIWHYPRVTQWNHKWIHAQHFTLFPFISFFCLLAWPSNTKQSIWMVSNFNLCNHLHYPLEWAHPPSHAKMNSWYLLMNNITRPPCFTNMLQMNFACTLILLSLTLCTAQSVLMFFIYIA